MRTSLFVVAVGFLVGVFWRSLFDIGIWGIATLVFLTVGLLLVGIIGRFHHSLYFVLLLLALVLGVARTEIAYQSFTEGQQFVEEQHVLLTGTVVKEPDVREHHTILYVDIVSEGYETRFKVNVPHYPAYGYGDDISLSGTVRAPVSFESETGRVFDYPGYLMKDGVHYELRDASVEALTSNSGNPITRTLLAWKQEWLAAVSQLLPEPNASLLGGLVVGAKRSLGDEWLDAFRDTGIIHIVVLSGYNLTLVANSVVRATAFLPRTVGFMGGVLGIVAFALMVGASATVVRASIMGVLGMLAAFTNRPHVLMRMLVLAALAMVAWNPFVLLFDPGFQLSFIATLGLIYGATPMERYVSFITERFGLRGIVAATLATQIAVLPLLVYQVGTASIVAPLVNVLVLPVVPVIMLCGFVAGMVGLILTPLAIPLAWLTHILLSYIFVVVDAFSRVPFVSISLPPIPGWFLFVLYGLGIVVWMLFVMDDQKQNNHSK